MPAGSTSMLNDGLPVTIAALSMPLIGLPMILKFFGSLYAALTASTAGGVIAATRDDSDAYVASRLDDACMTLPLPVVSSPAGTFHCAAAAVTIIRRPAAPTCRIGS